MGKEQWILAAGLVIAALIVAVGFNMNMLNQQKDTGKQLTVELPGYLVKGTNSVTNGSAISASDGTISFAADNSGTITRLISVSGTITKTIAPDQALIVLSVETLDKSASKSQSDNAELATKVREALKNAGIEEKDIKTSSYNLQEEFQWNETLRKSESIGYKTTNSIRITVNDLTKTGSLIDAAVQAGANRVNSVSFTLSQAKEDELRVSALTEAAANAKTRAQNIATGLGITVGQVYSASENSNYYTPYYNIDYAMEKSSLGGAAATTPITPGDIEFTATVSVQFEIQ